MTDAGVHELRRGVQAAHSIHQCIVDNNPNVSEAVAFKLKKAVLFNLQEPEVTAMLNLVADNDPSKPVLDFSTREAGHVTDEQLILIADYLVENTALRVIDLSNNHIGNTSVHCLFDALIEGRRKSGIHTLKLKNTLIRGNTQFGEALCEVLRRCPKLQCVDISYLELEPPCCELIYDAVKHNSNLLHFGCTDCGFSEKQLRDIRNVISINVHDSLESNPKGEDDLLLTKSFDKLPESFSSLPRLEDGYASVERLELSKSGFTESMLSRIMGTVEQNPNVVFIDLSNNGISDLYLAEFLRALIRNCTVVEINFAGNKAGALTMEVLNETIDANTTLRFIDLSDNEGIVADALVDLRANILSRTDTICRIRLSVPPIYPPRTSAAAAQYEPVYPALTLTDRQELVAFFNTSLTINQQLHVKNALPSLFNDDPHVKDIDFSSFTTHDDVGCAEIGRAIMRNSNLVSLNLSNGNIGNDGAKCISEGLFINRSVTAIDVSRNNIGDDGIKFLCAALQVNPVLKIVRIGGNKHVTDTSIDYLQRVLVHNDDVEEVSLLNSSKVDPTNIKRVDFVTMLNRKHLGMKRLLRSSKELLSSEVDCSSAAAQGRVFDSVACEVLCDALRENKFVTRVNLSDNQLDTAAANAIAAMLVDNRTLTSLNLSKNPIGNGSLAIADSLEVNDVLTEMDLMGCGCTALSLERIQLLLQLNREPISMKLEMLRILKKREENQSSVRVNNMALPPSWSSARKAQLDDSSMEILYSVLQSDPDVVSLDLSWNAISDSGFHTLLLLLRRNTGISRVNLSHNLIGDDALALIQKFIPSLPGLRSVDLSFNAVTEQMAPRALDLVRDYPQLESLNLEGNRVPPAALDTLEFLGRVNRSVSPTMRSILLSTFYNDPTVTEVDLSSFYSQGHWAKDGSTTSLLCFALYNNTHVQCLRMEFNDVDDEQISLLCKALQRLHTLRTLSVANNLIMDAKPLAELLLRDDTRLEVLDLRNNKLGVDAAREIASALRENAMLREIDLSKQLWGRAGAKVIREVLPFNSGLKTIDIGGEGIPRELEEETKFALTLQYYKIPQSVALL
jgi:Ran GTPase-activating protein (RanGAP) involved in mRNA processing and transport